MSIAFVCGQVKREAENPKSNANTIIRKLRNNMILEDIISLKLLLYDTSGTPLKQDLINYKYDCSFFPAIKPEMLEDPCYPHCHMDRICEKAFLFLRINLMISSHSDCTKSCSILFFLCSDPSM
jgi:hypothetical protein